MDITVSKYGNIIQHTTYMKIENDNKVFFLFSSSLEIGSCTLMNNLTENHCLLVLLSVVVEKSHTHTKAWKTKPKHEMDKVKKE